MLQPQERVLREETQPRARIGRRLAFILLPVVLVPMIAMGGLAYLRTRSLLRQEAVNQMVSATQGETTAIMDWADARNQHLFLASQRSRLQDSIRAYMAKGGAETARFPIENELGKIKAQGGEDLFSEILLAQISDRTVIAATKPENENLKLDWLADFKPNNVYTLPLLNDPIFSPESICFLSITPLRLQGEQLPSHYLIGVNSGRHIVQLMEDLQVFWQRVGVYRVERGNTFLALAPETLISLRRYAAAVEIQTQPSHAIFAAAKSPEANILSYDSPEGESVLGAYQWIPDWQMAIVVEMPEADIFSGLTNLAPFMLALILIVAIISLIIVVLTTNRTLRPLTSLAQFADRISRGEWQHRLEENRKDELGALAGALNRMAEELAALYQSLEAKVEERTRQVRTASEVARAVISIPSLDELLRQAVYLIRERFGYDHVSIFLIDQENHFAVLRESAGEIGGQSHPRGRKSEIGSHTLIGWVVNEQKAKIIAKDDQDQIEYGDELLPGAASEAAIPLQIAGQPLGALDAQSIHKDAFKGEELEVLQTLADQLSAAIENARLAQESANAAERARLVSEVTGQLSGLMDPQLVLQTATQALHRALGGAEIILKLTPPDDETE
jgi:HAMP domain-containing protein